MDIEVYNRSDGLSHRNVFRIAQDTSGYIWLATLSGLNRFDGYEFEQFAVPDNQRVGSDGYTNFVHLGRSGRIWASALDRIWIQHTVGDQTTFRTKDGPSERRRGVIASRMETVGGRLWFISQEEATGSLSLRSLLPAEGAVTTHFQLAGQYPQRPLASAGTELFVGAAERELWTIDGPSGKLLRNEEVPGASDARIVDLQTTKRELYVLLSDGSLYRRHLDDTRFQPVATPIDLPPGQGVSSLLVEANGTLWIGGLGLLYTYDTWQRNWTDLDGLIRQLLKQTVNYRQIFADRSGAVWLATDMGAIKVARSEKLFSHYLDGGSEFCSDVMCSTRGITEDERGRVYLSHYNSIHVLNPATNDLRPLFPANNYFNYPFGLHYQNNRLFTGNGEVIDLVTLTTSSLFNSSRQDKGVIAPGPGAGELFFGYESNLYRYRPGRADSIYAWPTNELPWAAGGLTISYLAANDSLLFVATAEDGLYRLHRPSGRWKHWSAGRGRQPLIHQRINVVHLDSVGGVWLGTAAGLQYLPPDEQAAPRNYGAAGVLPDGFVNGILPEGDSALWISTDNGLCRFSLLTATCTNFFTSDGLTSDEFNRISFYRSRSGRLYFGGLDGVNAFYPDNRYLDYAAERREVPLLVTRLDYIDGREDSVISPTDRSGDSPLLLNYSDRLLNIQVALADYRSPADNQFSYLLEGYDKEWSEPSTNHQLLYTQLPAGRYRLRIRARANERSKWMTREVSLPILVQQPYYYTFWFWAGLAAFVFLCLLAISRYRLRLSRRRREQLEREVTARTSELEDSRRETEALLLNILPAETAEELKRDGRARAHRYESVTVFFSDFVQFTAIANQLEPEELVYEVDVCFRAYDAIVAKHGLEKIKTIGDAYLFIGGLNGDGRTAARNCLRAARDIQRWQRKHGEECRRTGRPVFRARVGLHTGPLVTGVVGTHKFAYDIWGETVNIASRMESSSLPHRINVSEVTYRLLEGEFAFTSHGTYREHEREMGMWLLEEEEKV